MKLLTKSLMKKIPPLYATDKTPGAKKKFWAKFVTPDSQWTCYVAEGNAILADGTEVPLSDPRANDAVDVRFFGLVQGMEEELGYFMLKELESVRGSLNLPVERDRYFTPGPKERGGAGGKRRHGGGKNVVAEAVELSKLLK